MPVITVIRSLLAGHRRGLAGALLIATVILGVVSMHAAQGPSSTHVSPSVVAAAADGHVDSGDLHAHDAVGIDEHRTTDCLHECDGHHAATAMCLMVLVGLLTLAAPGAGVVVRLRPVLWLVGRMTTTRVALDAAPSLHAMGISRT